MPRFLADPFPTRSGTLAKGAALVGHDAALEAFRSRVEATRAGAIGGPLILCGPKGTGRATVLREFDRLGPELRTLVIDADTPSRAIEHGLSMMERYQRDLVEQVRRDCPDLGPARRLGEIARRMSVVLAMTVERPDGDELAEWFAADRTARAADDPFLLVITTADDLSSYWRAHREPGDPMPDVVSSLPMTRDETIEYITEAFSRALDAHDAPPGTGISPLAAAMIADASGGFTDLIATFGNAAWKYYRTRPLEKPAAIPGDGAKDRKRQLRNASEYRQGRLLDTAVTRKAIDHCLSSKRGLNTVVRDRQAALVATLPDALYSTVRALAICGPGATANDLIAALDPSTNTPVMTDATALLEAIAALDALGFTTAEDGHLTLRHPAVAAAAMHGPTHTARSRNAEISAPDSAGR